MGPALGEPDTVLVRAGVEGGPDGRAGRGFTPPPGVRGHPPEEAWTCPASKS
ncbi:hypothetical protein ACIP4W_06665 [Streptomyces sp. NPDC088846]|uniref:hypothetical protein n=1 Tax=Streptomyces sp. NPDC088846 TaxID=3365908 RepID=UPI00381C5355